MGSTTESIRGTGMLKIIAVAAVVAFAAGIMVGLNASSDGAPSGEQVLSSAISANTDVPWPDVTSPDRTSEIERINAEIAVLRVLERSIAERNGEYETLITDITRLQTIKSALEGEIEAAVFLSGAASGQ